MTEPAFYRLSEELLTLIAESLVDEDSTYWICRNVFPRLKTLRLVHSRFAYLSGIQKVLFRGISLIADPKHLDVVEATDVTIEGEFWAIAEEQLDSESASSLDSGVSGSHPRGQDGSHDERDRPLWWYDRVDPGYLQYRKRARAAQVAWEDNRVKNTWFRTVRALPHAHAFRVGKWIVGKNDPEWAEDTPLNRVVRRTLDQEIESEEYRGRFAACLGDRVCYAAIQSFLNTGRKPTEMDLRHDTLGESLRRNFPDRRCRALKELQVLHFRPWAYGMSFDGEHFRPEDDDRGAQEAAPALNSILQSCASSLRHLSMMNDCPITFPPADPTHGVPVLPQLRRLEINGIGLNPQAFGPWLLQCTQLEHISMASTYLISGDFSQWRQVFDGIRNHPNRMHVWLEEIISNGGSEMSMSHHTSEQVDVTLSDQPFESGVESLCGYLSKSCDWNAALQAWFPAD